MHCYVERFFGWRMRSKGLLWSAAACEQSALSVRFKVSEAGCEGPGYRQVCRKEGSRRMTVLHHFRRSLPTLAIPTLRQYMTEKKARHGDMAEGRGHEQVR